MSPTMLRWVGTLLAALVLAAPAAGEDPLEAARALLNTWHQDPARIDHARVLLEQASARQPTGEALAELSRAWFLVGDLRARSEAEKVAAWERGSEVGKRAVTVAPKNDQAHLWYAINTGKVAEHRGALKALGLLSIIREESDTVLRLNPRNVDGLILAGGILANLPGIMGGDRIKAEAHFKRALEEDPHKTSARIELARLYIGARRWAEARGQLQRVLDESAPTDRPRWTIRDAPRARSLLADLAVRDGGPVGPGQSP